MKIAIDARMAGPEQTGIGYYSQNLIQNLLKIDQENQYVLFLTEKNFDLFGNNSNLKKLLADVKWYTMAEQTRLPQIFFKEQADLWHFPNFNRPLLYPENFIVTIHDLTPLYYPGPLVKKSKLRKLAFQTVFNSSIKNAAHVITVSDYSKNDILDKFGLVKEKISVTYEGVSDNFQPVKNYDKIKETINKYRISKPFIFYTGSWLSHKNIEGLIKAFSLLINNYRFDLQLVLGGKSDRQEIIELWQKMNLSDRVIATDFIPESELPTLYSAAECFVLPSFYEGFGLIGLEAMACACPVVSSNATCLPEIYGQAAGYFDPGQASEMADKIHTVLSNPELKQSLINKGFDNLKRFSWQKCAQQTLNIYLSHASKKTEAKKTN